MTVDTVTIVASKVRGNDTIDHSLLGLSDPLGYTISGTGSDIVSTVVTVTLTNHAGQSVGQGTCTLTPNEDGTAFSGTGELTNLNRMRLRTTHNTDGYCTLSVTVEDITATASITVVIATPWGIKARYFAGKPDRITDDGLDPPVEFWVMPDSTVAAQIEASIRRFEAMSTVLLRRRWFATRCLKQSGDIEVGAVDLNRQTGKNWLTFVTPHCYLLDTPDVRTFFGAREFFHPPDEWRESNTDRRLGLIRHVPITASGSAFAYAINVSAQAPMFPLGALSQTPAGNAYGSIQAPPYSEGRKANVPDSIQFRYEAGWPEEDEEIPAHWVQWIERDVQIAIAPEWERSISDGYGSQSLSMDGLSQSQSNPDPHFTRWLESAEKSHEAEWKRISSEFPVRPLVLE